MTTSAIAFDLALKDAVTAELQWTPSINSAAIGVSVVNGTVTLSGKVDSYPQKLLASRAAQRVQGVSSIAQEITVANTWRGIDDSDVAAGAAEALRRSVDVPESVNAAVQNHAVTLSGSVEWQFEREAAERAVRYLKGVGAVHNLVLVQPRVRARDIKAAIVLSFVRSAQLENATIGVTTDVSGGVALRGIVRSWSERRQAEHAAWAAPGVTSVENQLRVV